MTRPASLLFSIGYAALSSEMALRTEKAFGLKMDTLLRTQTAYEIAEAGDREGNIRVKRYVVKPATTHNESHPGDRASMTL